MNNIQIKNILTPIIAALAVWLASKVPLLDQATWNTLISTIAFAIVAVVTGVFSTNSSVAATTQKMSGVEVTPQPGAPAGVAEAVNAAKASG